MRLRALLAVALAVFAGSATASMENDGTWAAGVWAPTVWADGVWLEDAPACEMCVAVPDVVGEADFAAADAILEGDGLDAGTEIEQCSSEAENVIVAQDPTAGVEVEAGSLVNLWSSNGEACRGGGQGISIGIRIGL